MIHDPDHSDDFVVLIDEEEAFSSLDDAAAAYLAAQGISPETASAFRLGQVSPAALARLGLTGRRALSAGGVSLPTWLPSDPSRVAGIVRMTCAQNKHGFVTPPVGIAGPLSLVTAARVVLTITPRLAMTLHQSGVEHVALIEDVAVLAGLTAWLAGRELVLVAHHAEQVECLRAALGERGVGLPSFFVATSFVFSAEIRAALGMTVAPVAQAKPPITALMLTQLHQYARSRVAAGEARAALVTLGMDDPDLVAAYRIGFLPSDYRNALSRDVQRALEGHSCGSSLMIPAFDAAGTIVDALVLRTFAGSQPLPSFWSAPRGLLAPEMATSFNEVLVTDCAPWLARLFRQGHRNVLLLRGAEDARNNAPRLRHAGVERVVLRARRDADAMAQALHAGGLSVELVHEAVADELQVPTPRTASALIETLTASAPTSTTLPSEPVSVKAVLPAAASPAVAALPVVITPTAIPATPAAVLAFVEEDRTGKTLIFEAGPFRYVVDVRSDGCTTRHIIARCGGKPSEDDVDLAVHRSCDRFAGNAAATMRQPPATVLGHVLALWPLVRAWEDARDQPAAVPISDEDRAAGLALLDAPDVLEQVDLDLTTLGWLGEGRAKRVLFLTSISRLLPRPLWTVYQAGQGAAPWQAVGCVAALTPSEGRLVFHRLSEAALMQTDRASLRHRLLVVDSAETLRPEAAVALRVLHERGGVGWATVGVTGMTPAGGDARGPVSVLAAASGPLDHRCRDAFLVVTADETAAQTAAILTEQRQRLAGGGSSVRDAAVVVARHHAAQRLLERLPVRVPFADRIVFPASRIRHRDEQQWLLGLIAAHALLYQRQRPRAGGAVLATEADFIAVVACTAGLIGTGVGRISPAARQMLSALFEEKLTTFTMDDLSGLFPDWTRYAFRAALQDVMDFGHVESPSDGGRGRLRQFKLATRAAGGLFSPGGIYLRPASIEPVNDAAAAESTGAAAVGELAEVGDRSNANFIPRLTGT